MADNREAPQSVEEAGALLGAAITRYGTGVQASITPPKGMHSSFAANSPVPSSELMMSLHALRALLRSAPESIPLVAAPSLLAGVLMKLLGVSSSVASAPPDPNRRSATPPMLSTPLRRLWVDCVVLCHRLGEGLSGNARVNIYGFVRNMISLAGMNPRTAKAAGGVRVAAFEAIAGLFEDPKLSPQLASWAMDVVQLSQRALRSSGNGEPTYRVASINAACAVAVACRQSSMKLRPVEGSACLVLKGAMEDKAILEVVKLLKLAAMDKFPEVRSAGGALAGLLAPVLIHTNVRKPHSSNDGAASSPTMSLEDVMTIAFRNIDDESPEVASGWADALSRCMSTSIEYSKQLSVENTTRRNVEGDGPSTPETKEALNRRKGIVPVSVCSTLPGAMKYLVGHFVKAGGELVALRAGGTYSTGGRALRLGFARALVQLLRLQSELGAIGEGRGASSKEAILIILTMVGLDMETQLNLHDRSTPQAESLDATSVVPVTPYEAQPVNPLFGQVPAANPLFGQLPKKSHCDPGIARMATSRVLREGIVELASETSQLSILHDLINLCSTGQKNVTANQLQVALIEISHLLATLGEAAGSSIEDLVSAINRCLRHSSHGVRHEAAVAAAAFASVFPCDGRHLVQAAVNDIQLEHAELMALASTKKVEEDTQDTSTPRFLRFGKRAAPPKVVKTDESLKHQYAVHGLSLMVSMVIRDLPALPGGLPDDLLSTVLSVAEILASTLFNDVMTRSNPSAACTSVRAGFGHLICGALTTGPAAVAKHIALIFGLWQKTKKPSERGPKFTAGHDLICVDAVLSSIVAFLKHCSELLLSIPDALSRTSLILEELLPLFLPGGKLGSSPTNPLAASRWQSAKASIMEAFSWLPPGSYPMAADSLFSFAASHIQEAVHDGVICSKLQALVNKEDALLDAMSFSRAHSTGQVCGARDLDEDIILLSSEVAHHSERESVLYFISPETHQMHPKKRREFRGSQVLGMVALGEPQKPPTPLHAVGTWRAPIDPSCSSKVRLVDAAIQAFSATFGLKSGKEQQEAMQMLDFLVPSIYTQANRATMGVSTSLAEQDRRAKTKEDYPAVANIIAVLLSCLQALPLHESTHNVPIGLGPPWMSKAKDMLLTLLPSSSHVVRRAAAEGLALLATLGVSADAHFLQSTVLHSLDEVMQGNQPDGKQRAIPLEAVSAARAGSLLTLGCIQRTAYNIQTERSARTRGRGNSVAKDDEDTLPTLQMMTRLLPSLACYGVRDYFNVRTYALHSFGVLLAYSNRVDDNLNAEDTHLLKKGVEIVEDNFLAAWTVASFDYDRGNEAEKMSSEPSFLAVLLRLMTLLTPSLQHLKSSDPNVASRFSTMATIILECYGTHSVVITEAMAVFEVLAEQQHLLPPPSSKIQYSENPLLSCIPFLIKNITPDRPEAQPVGRWHSARGCLSSKVGFRSTLCAIKVMSLSHVLIAEWSDMRLVSALFAALEAICASRCFSGETIHRSLAAPRDAELVYSGGDATEHEIVDAIRLLLYLERAMSKKSTAMLFRWILFSRVLLAGVNSSNPDVEDEESFTLARVIQTASEKALSDVSPVYEVANPPRWQVKSIATHMASTALAEMVLSCRLGSDRSFESSPTFNPELARTVCSAECRSAASSGLDLPHSHLALHLNDLVTTTCAMATATVDQAELRILQEGALKMLAELIQSFGSIRDADGASILGDFIPQLSSCIKYALGAFHEIENEKSHRLFIAGCEVLRAFVAVEMTSDKMVMKRVMRGVFLNSDEVPFFDLESGLPKEFFEIDESNRYTNQRASLLVRIGKIWTLGVIPPEYLTEVNAREDELGVHSAALALDGAYLLSRSGLSLCGDPFPHGVDEPSSRASKCGFLFRNDINIDDSVRAASVKTWASNCCTGAKFLTKYLGSGDASPKKREACSAWLNTLVPLLFAGLRDAFSKISASKSKEDTVEWARGIDAYDVAVSCIQGVTSLVSATSENGHEWKDSIEQAVMDISRHVLEIELDQNSKVLNLNRHGSRIGLVAASCELIETVALRLTSVISESSSLLLTLLNALHMLETGSVDIQDEKAGVVIAACLNSMATLISKSNLPINLVKPMLPIVVDVLSTGKEVPRITSAAAGSLLKECLSHDAITPKEHSRIAVEMANSENWAAWTIVCGANDGVAVDETMEVVKGFLLDSSRSSRQLAALKAVHTLVQNKPPPSPMLGRIVFAVGAEVLAVLQGFATLNVPTDSQSHRTTACADAVKIVLVGYQQLVSDASPDEIITGFLLVLFETFIAVIRYNGLPNHPPPQSGSDPSLGRMCAQATLHAARTTPNPFKTCLASMADHDRAVLEFAVRAEMSGYAAPASQAPTKKKLSLKGFKK